MTGPHRNAPRREAGFSLIEVLAALVVFSVAIIGLIHAGTQGAQSVTVLQGKMLASVVADNVLTQARAQPLRLGTQTGEQGQMSRRFDWTLQTIETEVPDFYRLSVEVRRDGGDQILITRDAFRTALTAAESRREDEIIVTPTVPEPDE